MIASETEMIQCYLSLNCTLTLVYECTAMMSISYQENPEQRNCCI